MTDGQVAVADSLQPRETPGVLTFVAADVFSFLLFFAVFMAERLEQPALFRQSAALLDPRIGFANTIILLSSGWLVALATDACRRGEGRAITWRLIAALIVGSGFGLLKLVEYAIKLDQGLTPLTNAFFGYYFIFTAIHFLHYLAGMVLLAGLALRSRRSAGRRFRRWMEGGALYWHMVDLLWIFLFPMLYLQG